MWNWLKVETIILLSCRLVEHVRVAWNQWETNACIGAQQNVKELRMNFGMNCMHQRKRDITFPGRRANPNLTKIQPNNKTSCCPPICSQTNGVGLFKIPTVLTGGNPAFLRMLLHTRVVYFMSYNHRSRKNYMFGVTPLQPLEGLSKAVCQLCH